MQSILNEVLYHTKVDGNKLTFRQFNNWFLIPDDVTIIDDVTITDDYEQFILSLVESNSYCVKDAIITVLNNQESKTIKVSESKEQSRGVFWLIDDEIFAFPFYDGVKDGISKSGLTLNHKRLWNAMKSNNAIKLNNNLTYNYYPRGRVDFDNKNRPVVYMNPNIGQEYIAKIQKEFGLRETPRIIYDNSEHYKCYLDDGWKPDRSR